MNNHLLLIIGLLALLSCGQTTPPSAYSGAIKSQIDSIFSDYDQLDSPGYAIGISQDGEAFYANAYGAANLDYNIPITTNSAFSIASVSKQFTTACIALLILEEKLDLDDSASDYIPELKKFADDIKIKHLVYNTSGITDYFRLPRKSGISWVTFNYFDVEECIATSLAEEQLQFTPGERWDYCNVNFMLLTKIVEKVSGQSFADFIEKRLFQPLGMSNTIINDDITAIIPSRVTPYNLRTQQYLDSYAAEGFKLKPSGKYLQHPRNSPHYGGSGVVSTIEDLLKWTTNMETKKFGGQAFYDLMHQTLKFEHDRSNQAMGLYFSNYNGRTSVAWDGGDYGISSQILRFPDQGISIVVLSNLGSGQAARKATAIADVLIEQGVL